MTVYARLLVFGPLVVAVLYLLISGALALRACLRARSGGICACGWHIHDERSAFGVPSGRG